MTAPITSKAWTISPNNRLVYPGTLAGVLGWWAFTNKTQLLAATWTLVWSSDGVTGPSGAGDNTDRIPNAAAFTTRATVAAAPQSWFLLQNPDGFQLLITYQGATDDIARVSYSAAGLYALAGTTTHQPTATDEVVLSTATTIVGASTTIDRVMSIWTADDGSAWRCPVFASGAFQSCLTVDKVTRIAPATTFPWPYVAGNFVRMDRSYLNDAVNVATPVYMELQATWDLGEPSYRGFNGRVFTGGVSRAARMFGQQALISGGDNTANGNTLANGGVIFVLASTYCASMGGTGALCWPIHLMGAKTVNLDGPWGTLIDWHQVITTSLSNPGATDSMPGYEVGDTPGVSPATPRTNWWVALGAGALWPWKNVAASMEIA